MLNDLNAPNFTYDNLSGVFNDLSEKEEVFVDSYHFGDIGNKIIAAGIYNNIKDSLTNK